MRTKPLGLSLVLIGMALALSDMVRGEDVTYTFTGMGTHGSLAWGQFTTGKVLEPDYFAPGGIYAAFSLTISNIPGNSPSIVIFQKTELEIFSQFTISGGVPSIVPLGGHGYGPPDEHHYDLSGGVEPNQSTLIYDRFYRDDITWSGLTIISPPVLPMLSGETAGTDINLFWTNNAAGFMLQETASLMPPNWMVVTNVPVVTNGNFSVTLPRNVEGTYFFRLEQPGQ